MPLHAKARPACEHSAPQFCPKRAHFRDAVQPHELAPFAGRLVSQGLHRRDPCQGHEGQKKEDTFQRIIPFRHRKVFALKRQQTVLQQGRQCEQDPAARHILHGLKCNRRSVKLAHRRSYPFQRACGRASQRCLAVDYAALAFCPRA
jgi:hypothetical protein